MSEVIDVPLKGGRLVADGELVRLELSGMSGLIRRKPWSRTWEVPQAECRARMNGLGLSVYQGDRLLQLVNPVSYNDGLAFASAVGEASAPAPAVAPEPAVMVRSYKSAGDFQSDAEKLAKLGWRPSTQGQSAQKVAVGRTLMKGALTGGAGLLLTGRSKKGGEIIVTYTR